MFERNAELELAPLAVRERIELTLLFVGLCIESGGATLWSGAVRLDVRGSTPWIGLWVMLGGIVLYCLMFWLMQPHKAAKHAAHRVRHHTRKLRPHPAVPKAPPMTEAQFEALEDAVDRAASETPN